MVSQQTPQERQLPGCPTSDFHFYPMATTLPDLGIKQKYPPYMCPEMVEKIGAQIGFADKPSPISESEVSDSVPDEPRSAFHHTPNSAPGSVYNQELYDRQIPVAASYHPNQDHGNLAYNHPAMHGISEYSSVAFNTAPHHAEPTVFGRITPIESVPARFTTPLPQYPSVLRQRQHSYPSPIYNSWCPGEPNAHLLFSSHTAHSTPGFGGMMTPEMIPDDSLYGSNYGCPTTAHYEAQPPAKVSSLRGAAQVAPAPSSKVYAPVTPPHSFTGISKQSHKSSEKGKNACKVCGKTFSRPSALQTHAYTHTGEKPFRCDSEGCGSCFSVVSNLRRHKRVHMQK